MKRIDHTVNGRVYSMLRPTAFEGMSLSLRVSKAIAMVLSSTDDSGVAKDIINIAQTQTGEGIQPGGDINTGVVLSVFAKAVSKIDPTDMEGLIKDAVRISTLTFQGNVSISRESEFNRHFEEYREDVFPVCIWCIWECVKDFFPQLGAFAQRARAAAENTLKFQTASGPSTTGSEDLSGKGSAPGPSSKAWEFAK